MKKFWLPLIFLVLAMPLSALAAEGVKGRSSLGGKLVGKISIRAYSYRPGSFGPLTGEPVLKTTATREDGFYDLPLPPGRYVIEALQKKAGNKAATPEPGDLYCLHSGSPVTVNANTWEPVGLSLSEVPREVRAKGEGARLKGTLTLKNKPVERAYLYAYTSVAGDFRVPSEILQPVEKGSFDIKLPPGKYYILARKRARGGPYGPIDTGDLFNFYPLNPLSIKDGEAVTIALPMVEKLSQLDETGQHAGLTIKVTDSAGKPLKGQYVMAYQSAARTGPPAAAAGPTGADGTVKLALPPGAKYLRARASVGGPLDEGESFGDAEAPKIPEASLTIKIGAK